MPRKSGKATPTSTYLFLSGLVALEALTVKYWINGRIYTVSFPTLAQLCDTRLTSHHDPSSFHLLSVCHLSLPTLARPPFATFNSRVSSRRSLRLGCTGWVVQKSLE